MMNKILNVWSFHMKFIKLAKACFKFFYFYIYPLYTKGLDSSFWFDTINIVHLKGCQVIIKKKCILLSEDLFYLYK